ncbi:hypothetical protein BJ170DRAFT_75536 [Xylariales sp. AK1849]|nr:hypothetical protein BJ170DRAFT_75536 [Xylariales sp. AK1849]
MQPCLGEKELLCHYCFFISRSLSVKSKPGRETEKTGPLSPSCGHSGGDIVVFYIYTIRLIEDPRLSSDPCQRTRHLRPRHLINSPAVRLKYQPSVPNRRPNVRNTMPNLMDGVLEVGYADIRILTFKNVETGCWGLLFKSINELKAGERPHDECPRWTHGYQCRCFWPGFDAGEMTTLVPPQLRTNGRRMVAEEIIQSDMRALLVGKLFLNMKVSDELRWYEDLPVNEESIGKSREEQEPYDGWYGGMDEGLYEEHLDPNEERCHYPSATSRRVDYVEKQDEGSDEKLDEGYLQETY